MSRYTISVEMDAHGMPGLHLATKSKRSACVFLTDEGCGVYEDRPSACRYYALGNMGVGKKEVGRIDNIFFLVKKPHCLGHNEPVKSLWLVIVLSKGSMNMTRSIGSGWMR